MGLIPESVIEQVLARADILGVVSQYVSLKKAGANHKGLCPFHDENTPSFNVNPGMGIYKCFGCGKGGNVIGFLMELEGWSFPETVRHLAQRNGVEIPEEDPEQADRREKRRKGRELYRRVMASAADYYAERLWGPSGAAARHYLAERGVDEQTARRFGLGYAPQGWQNMLDHLGGQGVSGKLVERAGLALARRKSSGFYDRFRHRVVFPVVDIWGHTLAFGARRLAEDEDSPKYINSPETRFYTKGEQLYGLHVAKQAIQKRGMALLVEGNFDVVTLHASGLTMAVSPMGTALTEAQARLLDRYAERIIVAFDGDQAGAEASVKCISALQETNLEALVIRFDEHEDPDTFVRRHGAGALWEKIEQAQPLVAWALDRILVPLEGANVERKMTGLEAAGELLAQVGNEVTWKHYAQEVSRRLAIEPRLVEAYVKKPEVYRQRARQAVVEADRSMELEPAEAGILGVLMKHPGWIGEFLEDDLDNLLASQELADFLESAHEHLRADGELNRAALLERVESRAFRNTVEDALVDRYQQVPADEKKHVRFFRECVRSLKRSWAQRTLEELTRELEGLDFREDRDAFAELHEQKKQVEQFKASLDRDLVH